MAPPGLGACKLASRRKLLRFLTAGQGREAICVAPHGTAALSADVSSRAPHGGDPKVHRRAAETVSMPAIPGMQRLGAAVAMLVVGAAAPARADISLSLY